MPRGRGGVRRAEFTGQGYGVAARQAESQAAVPPGPPPAQAAAQAAAPAAPAPVMAAPAGPDPGSLGSLLDPTARPDEPITAGLPTGAGPGPEVLTTPPAQSLDMTTVLAAYRANPHPAVRELIELMHTRGL